MTKLSPVVIVIGCAGNGLIVASVCEDAGVQVGGFLDDGYIDEEIMGYPVLGGIWDWKKFYEDGFRFVWTLQNAKKQEERYELYHSAELCGAAMSPPIVHPKASVSSHAEIGDGSVVMPGASVAPMAKIGRNVLVFENAVIDHHAEVGDFSYVCAGAFVGGKVKVGKGAWIGANCTVRENVVIGDFAVVGCGTVVLYDVPPRWIVVGNPARQLA